jgi:protein involved in polysaccharide export with SLBB domain
MKKNTVLLLLLVTVFGSAFSFAQEIVAGRGVEIRIQGVDANEQVRINGVYPVSNLGSVRMPDVGEVNIAGLQGNVAAAKLDAIYKKEGIYNNPTFQVTATTTTTGPREDMVTLAGSVRSPGPKAFTPGMTLYQAVAAAGGATEFGSMKRVIVMRGKSVKSYDLTNMQDRMVVLQRDDTIEIPDKNLWGQ